MSITVFLTKFSSLVVLVLFGIVPPTFAVSCVFKDGNLTKNIFALYILILVVELFLMAFIIR